MLLSPNQDSDDLSRSKVASLEQSMCPEGVLPVWWEKLVEARDVKIKHEEVLRTEQQALSLMKKQLEELLKEDKLAEERINDVVTEVRESVSTQIILWLIRETPFAEL